MLTRKEIEGKTLSELRELNARLCTELADEKTVLKALSFGVQAKFKDRKEQEEVEWEAMRNEILQRFYDDTDDLDVEWKTHGMKIGMLMDLRNNAQDEAALVTIRNQIEVLQSKRREIKKKRRERCKQYREEVLALKKKISEQKRVRYEEQGAENALIRERRLQLLKSYDDLYAAVREEITKRQAEERAEAVTG